ncbi:hypothetical protein MRX96_034827 [Rhipicephalus microplus]
MLVSNFQDFDVDLLPKETGRTKCRKDRQTLRHCAKVPRSARATVEKGDARKTQGRRHPDVSRLFGAAGSGGSRQYDCCYCKTPRRAGARSSRCRCRLPLNDPRGAFPPSPVCAPS